ncbi:MAG: hypothetical protein AAGC49_10355 [Brevundimonas sp.]
MSKPDENVPVPPVRGPAAIAMLCLRCAVVLAVLNVLAGAVLGAAEFGWALALVATLVSCVAVALVGWPAGLLTAWLLRRSRRESVHVLAFAAVGAAIGPLVVVPLTNGWHANVAIGAVAAAEGAIGAGTARWWSGRAHAGAATRQPPAPRPEPEDALIESQLARLRDREE